MAIRMAAVLAIGLMATGTVMAQAVQDQAVKADAEVVPEINVDAAAEAPQPDGAQQAPGQPIGGIVVNGDHNPTKGAKRVAGNPIGGIIVKGGKNPPPNR